MFWLKACPRCHGDLRIDSDHYGHFACCIQCGAYLDQPQQTLSQRRLRSSAFTEGPTQPALALKAAGESAA
jgi:hypothetical protein